jgi:hypothetical protein
VANLELLALEHARLNLKDHGVPDRRERQRPRLTLGATGLWSAALGAAMQPISRTFDPRFAAILKAGQP